MRLLVILLIAFLLLEGSVIYLPLLLDLLIILYIFKKNPQIFVIAGLSGLLLDVFLVRPLGFTAIFYTVSLFLIFLYERKYEVRTKEFVFFFSLLAGIFYFKFFSGGFYLTFAILNALLAAFLFVVLFSLQDRLAVDN